MKERETNSGNGAMFDAIENENEEDAGLNDIIEDCKINLIQESSTIALKFPTGEEFTVGEYEQLGEGDFALAFYRMYSASGDPEADSWKEGEEIIH